jgi:hypothetical protein
MAIIHYFADVPVTQEELQEKRRLGHFSSGQLSRGAAVPTIEFREGSVSTRELIAEFTPIGLGKPLSVEIACIYTGNVPNKVLGGKRELLATSAVKSFQVYEAAPRAIHFLERNVADRRFIRPTASEGCAVVYYSPAVEVSKTLFTFEMTVDRFKPETIDSILGLFKFASNIPVFAPANAVLLGGSAVVKMAGELIDLFTKDAPILTDTLEVPFGHAGQMNAQARFVAICDNRNAEELKNFVPQLVERGAGRHEVTLVDRATQQPYNGDAAYIIVSLDGKEREELRDFAPKMAGATILDQFYSTLEKGKIADHIQNALELYNDFNYFLRTQQLEKELAGLKPGTEAFKEIRTRLDAALKNMRTEVFRSQKPKKRKKPA